MPTIPINSFVSIVEAEEGILDRREALPGVNILILEGGGARGLSSLMILKELMVRLKHALGLTREPEVYEYFDVIAGTGTGAMIACMVGRLRISIDQAIQHYLKIAYVFLDRKIFGSTTHKMADLQSILKEIVRDATGDENTRMMDTTATSKKCRTMVFAMSRYNMNAGIPSVFRSYEGVANQMPDCTIWEALSASMAHPELFKSVDIGEGHQRESFIDGAFGCTNPTAHVLAETKALFLTRRLSAVICIGAGYPQTIQIPNSSSLTRILMATKQIVADGERVAQEMAIRFHATKDVYFRFSVDQGMQGIDMGDRERPSEVTAHARNYMQTSEVHDELGRAISTLMARKETIEMGKIDGHIQQPTTQQPIYSGTRNDAYW